MPSSSTYKNLVNITSNYYKTTYPTKLCRKVRNGCFYLTHKLFYHYFLCLSIILLFYFLLVFYILYYFYINFLFFYSVSPLKSNIPPLKLYKLLNPSSSRKVQATLLLTPILQYTSIGLSL